MMCTPANMYMIIALISFFVNVIYSAKLGDEEGFLRMFCGVLCICLIASCINTMCDEQSLIAWLSALICITLQVLGIIAMIRSMDKGSKPNSETESK